MQDHKDSLALWGQQVLRAQQAAQGLWDQSALLALAAQTVWLGLWVQWDQPESPAQRARREAPARTARPVRREIPEPLARQGLRVL